MLVPEPGARTQQPGSTSAAPPTSGRSLVTWRTPLELNTAILIGSRYDYAIRYSSAKRLNISRAENYRRHLIQHRPRRIFNYFCDFLRSFRTISPAAIATQEIALDRRRRISRRYRPLRPIYAHDQPAAGLRRRKKLRHFSRRVNMRPSIARPDEIRRHRRFCLLMLADFREARVAPFSAISYVYRCGR